MCKGIIASQAQTFGSLVYSDISILQKVEDLNEDQESLFGVGEIKKIENGTALEKAYLRMLQAEAFQFLEPKVIDIKQQGLDFSSNHYPSGNIMPRAFRDFSPEMQLIPGDVISVSVSGQLDLQLEAAIDTQLNIFFPKIGLIETRGMTYLEAISKIKKTFEDYYLDSQAYGRLSSPAPRTISASGYIIKPGVTPISGHLTLEEAISLQGGPTQLASLRTIVVSKGNSTSLIDMYESMYGGQASPILSGGEKIRIQGLRNTVLLLGETLEPGIYEMKEGETYANLLNLIHRTSPMADSQAVHVYRSTPGQFVEMKVLNHTSIKSEKPRNYDVIVIPARQHLTGTFVTLQGAIATPGNYELLESENLGNLIKRAGGLNRIHGPSAIIQRRLDTPLFVKDGSTHQSRVDFQIIDIRIPQAMGNFTLNAGDQIDIPIRSPELSEAKVTIHGEVIKPGEHPYFDGLTLKQLLVISGGTTPEAQTRKVTVSRPSQDRKSSSETILDLQDEQQLSYPILPGDQITIPSRTNYGILVSARGQFQLPGEYHLPSGSKISDLIKIAGGISENAYSPGIAFFRKSVARKNNLQLQELADQLEEDLIRSQQASIEGSLASQQLKNEQIFFKQERLIKKLRQTKSPGRVALNFPLSLEAFMTTANDIPLEDGDRIFVPTRPHTVSVLGQVFNPNTVAFKKEFSPIDYINASGGLKKSADTKNIYIVKANGFVVPLKSYNVGSNWITGSPRQSSSHRQVSPGDSILVPEDFEIQQNKLQVTKDISQIMFQILGSLGVLVAAF